MKAPDRPRVEVYGETELQERLARGEAHTSALVSIGNPRYPLGRTPPGTFVPPAFRASFPDVLRLGFFDADTKAQLVHMRPRRIALRKDIEKVVRFYEETRGRADGWTVHCWGGLSRSPAVALGLLYLIHGDEEEAGRELRRIRPIARPLQLVVGLFDEILGSRLSEVNDRIRAERIEEMKAELDLSADDLLEELEPFDE